jgi:hypothetical protein
MTRNPFSFANMVVTINPARQKDTAAMPCARTAKNGGVWYV